MYVSPHRVEVVIVKPDNYIKDVHYTMSFARSDYQIIANFTAKELACPTSNRIKVDSRFLYRLNELRYILGFPLPLNSCCRSSEHNIKVGGHYRSLHLMDNPYWDTLGTIACDISTFGWDSDRIKEFDEIAWDLGFSIGHANSFVHIDCRDLIGLPQARFTY